ncbi:hypothetical protein CARUB_v10000002mg [Capsella rubella]|uniref:Uncharacterized protein n=1 Tax=Capsella rubella TaxID=81985 RepID=R0GLN8_9BRAS|nr:hypothetical protein CARUB_v10000002mg [Capsella rubella]
MQRKPSLLKSNDVCDQAANAFEVELGPRLLNITLEPLPILGVNFISIVDTTTNARRSGARRTRHEHTLRSNLQEQESKSRQRRSSKCNWDL